MPVSGFGHSGLGTENAEAGLLEFTRLKHVMVDNR
jgi:betaine-aldehyde dehydrogenase